MQMLYNSDSFVVVHFEVSADAALPDSPLARGGYEIVDKFARRGLFIDGAMAQSFKDGVDALIETHPAGPTQDDMDDYIERFAPLMQQPVVMH